MPGPNNTHLLIQHRALTNRGEKENPRFNHPGSFMEHGLALRNATELCASYLRALGNSLLEPSHKYHITAHILI